MASYLERRITQNTLARQNIYILIHLSVQCQQNSELTRSLCIPGHAMPMIPGAAGSHSASLNITHFCLLFCIIPSQCSQHTDHPTGLVNQFPNKIKFSQIMLFTIVTQCLVGVNNFSSDDKIYSIKIFGSGYHNRV